MHKSSFLRMEYLLNYYKPLWQSENNSLIKVLDIGSYNQNGTYKDLLCDKRISYTGLDMSKGPNVDIVPQNIYSWNEIEDEVYDLVISGQVFEHIEYPWVTIKEIERILKPAGVCIIIAPNAGIEHKAPLDCYRFFSDGLIALAKWGGFEILHSGVAGVPYIKGTDEWVSEWNDSTLVAQKKPVTNTEFKEPFLYERRRNMDGTVSNMYKNWDFAVSKNFEKFHNNKKYVLFGAGAIGQRILRIIGEQNVYCFVDNSIEMQDKEICGKQVIAYSAFKQIHMNYNCIVTASCNVSTEIELQLQKDGICYGTLYPKNDV